MTRWPCPPILTGGVTGGASCRREAPLYFHGFGSTVSRTRRVRRSSTSGVGQRAKDQSFQPRPARLDGGSRPLPSVPRRGRKNGPSVRGRAENLPHGDAVGTGALGVRSVRHVGPCLQAPGESAWGIHAVRRPARTGPWPRKDLTSEALATPPHPAAMNPFRSSLV